MSNVLIGIIGVILFIGLALAGALFLGPRFQEATVNSKASAEISQVHQYAAAISMFELQEGEKYDDSKSDRLIPAYLKTLPRNTGGTNYAGYFVLNGVPVTFMNLSYNGLDKAICEAIQRQLTGTGTVPIMVGSTLPGKGGCFTNSAKDTYTVYERI
jgi:hypothetical protein